MTVDAFNSAPAGLEHYELTRLEKLRLATEAILEIAEDDALPGPFETELYIFRDRVHAALLHPGADKGLLPGGKHGLPERENEPDAA
jgi:hypothetical protein